MKVANRIIWGIVLIAVGIVYALNALDITNFNLFFDGWWTLFIIIPCAVGLVNDKNNIFGLIIGILLLLCAQDILSFELLWELLVPVIIILIGLKMILGTTNNKKIKELQQNASKKPNCFAAFSGQKMSFEGQVFDGAELNAVFGAVSLDLTGAIIETDCLVNATAIFGGVNIVVPDGVNVKITSNSVFGGASDKRHKRAIENAPTVYINATCLFGGAEIK